VWVTWSRNATTKAEAQKTIQIWGIPDGSSPPQVGDMFLSGPFATRADAKKYADAIGTGALLPPGGTPIVGSSGRGLTQTIANANPLAGLAAIGDFFGRLTQASTWIRVGEVVLGIALIIVGTAKLFSNTAVGKTAAKAGKVAMLL
jgi:hypothetical protein